MLKKLSTVGQNTGCAYELTVIIGDWFCANCRALGIVEVLPNNYARSQCEECGKVFFLKPEYSENLEIAVWKERNC